ncbi:hypothetical protein ES708_29806 [subsurface metagenome]
MPPPPDCLLIKEIAFAIFSSFAGTDSSENRFEQPAKSRTLNLSFGLRFLSRFFISCLETSKGNPCIEPETSTMKINSRGGISSGITFFGGCTIARKKFPFSPSYNISPDSILSPERR